MEYAIGYVAVIFVLQALAAWRTPFQDCRLVFITTLFWPFFVLAIALSLFLDFIGWNFDVVKSTKMLGFRKPTNPKMKGYGLTLFKIEFQLFKGR